MKFSIFSIIAASAALVSSVSAQDLPACAKDCISDIISQKLLTCTTPDVACVCSGTEPAVRNVAICAQGTCSRTDLEVFIAQIIAMCGDEPTTTTTAGTGTRTTTTRTTRVTAPTGGNNTTGRTTTTSAPVTTKTTTLTGNFTLTTTVSTTGSSGNGTTTTSSAATTTSSEGAAAKVMGGSGAAGMGGVAIALAVAAFLG